MAALADVSELAAFLQQAIADDDASAALYLNLASGRVRDYVGQTISQVADDVVYLDPVGPLVVFLPELPITEVSLVEALVDGAWTTMDPATYSVSLKTGAVAATDGLWPSAPSSWRVTYTHGFEVIPDGVKGVVLALAGDGYSTPVGVDNERIGQRSVKYTTRTFNAEELATLDGYRLGRIG
jgi:hypothetical protein